MADLSKLSTEDLVALKSGDLTKVSDAGLLALKETPAPQEISAPAEPSFVDKAKSAAVRGFAGGGLPGAALSLGGLGLKTADELVTKGAYKAGGAVTDVAANLGASPEVAGGLGFATNVGIQAVPALVGGLAAEKTAAPVIEKAGKDLMQSALKPTLKDLKSGRAAQAIQTMLDEGINATPGGAAKLREQIGGLNQQIAEAIKNSTATVDKKGAAWKSIKETLDKFKMQVSPGADLAKIKTTWDDFLNHPLISGDNIPVQLAQELKQGTYKVLSKKYGEMGGAETEAQKAIARGLKEGIADAVPGIAGLNAQESKLINTLNLVERRALLDANKNPGGLVWLIHNPAAAAAYLADKSALFKSLVGRMLNASSERLPQAVAGTGIAAIQATRNTPPR